MLRVIFLMLVSLVFLLLFGFFYLKNDFNLYRQLKNNNTINTLQAELPQPSSKLNYPYSQNILTMLKQKITQSRLQINNLQMDKENKRNWWLNGHGPPAAVEQFIFNLIASQIYPIQYMIQRTNNELNIEMLLHFPSQIAVEAHDSQQRLTPIFCPSIESNTREKNLQNHFSINSMHWLGWIESEDKILIVLQLPNQKIISINQDVVVATERVKFKRIYNHDLVFENAFQQQFYLHSVPKKKEFDA